MSGRANQSRTRVALRRSADMRRVGLRPWLADLALLGSLALLTGCATAPEPRFSAKLASLPARSALAILHRYDFPEVRGMTRIDDGWAASAWRDGVWLPVEVFDNGSLLVRQYPRYAALSGASPVPMPS
jgi:hypothetical protein